MRNNTKARPDRKKRIMFMTYILAFCLCFGTAFQTLPANAAVLLEPAGKFLSDYSTLDEARAAGKELAKDIAAEGMVLFKNENNALPLTIGERRVSMFGIGSVSAVYGGAGSGGSSGNVIHMHTAMKEAGFVINPALENFYTPLINNHRTQAALVSMPIKEVPVNWITRNVRESYRLYGDVAFIFIGRAGQETTDPPTDVRYNKDLRFGTKNTENHTYSGGYTYENYREESWHHQFDQHYHYLELSPEEKDLIMHVTEQAQKGVFKKVVAVLNTGMVFESAPLEDNPYIDAVIWAGNPGDDGGAVFPKLLTGEISPSGRTNAIWMADMTTDPTWQNFNGYNGGGRDENGVGSPQANRYRNQYGEYVSAGSQSAVGGAINGQVIAASEVEGKFGNSSASGQDNGYRLNTRKGWFYNVEYEEGIFSGYRWYETAYADGVLKDPLIGYDADGNYMIGDGDYFATGSYKLGPDDGPLGGETVEVPAKYANDYYNRSTGVVYPFGYGLSYTDFDWEIISAKIGGTDLEDFDILAADKGKSIEVKVKVTNSGLYAGKEVVQLYIKSQWFNGSVDKPEAVMYDFAKTRMLNPGASEILTLNIKVQDMASFDYDARSSRTTPGYILESGNYQLRLQTSSHEIKEDMTADFTVDANIEYNEDDTTGAPINAKMSDPNSVYYSLNDNTYSNMHIMRRGSFATTFPDKVTVNELRLTDAEYAYFAYTLRWDMEKERATVAGETVEVTAYSRSEAYVGSGTPENPEVPAGAVKANVDTTKLAGVDSWIKSNADIPAGWTQAENATEQAPWTLNYNGETMTFGRTGGTALVQMKEMSGIPRTGDGAPVWEAFMNQLTFSEMHTLLENGGYRTSAVSSIGKIQATDNDGPHRINGSDAFPIASMLGSTWSKELARMFGQMAGNLTILNNRHGWYAPGIDALRSPFGGRNFEYYSQDGFHGGKIAKEAVSGARSKGTNVYIKHFGLNDQENHRGEGYSGLFTFVTEQAIREIYFKQFELVFKGSNVTSTMLGFNRVGDVNLTVNAHVNNDLLRGEWGFDGTVLTDYYGSEYNPRMLMIRNGCDLPLRTGNDGGTWTWDATKRDGKGNVTAEYGTGEEAVVVESATQWIATRNSAMNVIFVAANTANNRNGLNTYDMYAISGRTNITYDMLNGALTGQRAAAGVPFSLSTISTENLAELTQSSVTGKVTFTITSGTLPAGLTLNSSTGVISGTPTTVSTSNIDVTVRCAADDWVSFDKQLRFQSGIRDPLSFSTALNTARVGVAFSTTLSSDIFNVNPSYNEERENLNSGFGSVTYSIQNNSLPAGLTLNASTGIISGIPTTAGTFTTSIRVALQHRNAAGTGNTTTNIDRTYTFTIAPADSILTEEQVNNMIAGKLDASAIDGIIAAATAGFLDEADIEAILAGKGYQTAAQVTSAITAAMDANAKGFINTSQAQNLIDASIAGFLEEADIETILAGKGYQTAAQVTSAITAAMDANAKGFINTSQAQTLIDASIAGFLEEADIETILAGKGYQTAAQVTSAIEAVLTANAKGFISSEEADELIDAAVKDNLTSAQIQKMIDDSIAAGKGCGNGGASIVALLGLLSMAFVVLIKKQF